MEADDRRRLAAGIVLTIALFGLAALLGGLPQVSSALADGTIIHVPGDAASIQAAVDMAADGDEIQVQSGQFFENLIITKSVKLTGGWDVAFTEQTKDRTVVNAGNKGRVLTVLPGAVDTSVVISHVVFANGNATGLGGVITPTIASVAVAEGEPNTRMDAAAVEQQTAALRSQLVKLGAAGQFPGGEAALSKALARIDALTQRKQQAASPQPAQPGRVAPSAAGEEIDCGGGIYVRGAHLTLISTSVHLSVASTTRSGAGGGVCAVDMPAQGLVFAGVALNGNIASKAGYGYGGGLFYAGGATPVAESLVIDNAGFRNNTASTAGEGYGGGAFVLRAPAASLSAVAFGDNVAASNSMQGFGGGLYLAESDDVSVTQAAFELNVANTTLTFSDPNGYAVGVGGGMYLADLKRFHLTGGADDENRSLFVGNWGVWEAVGNGGAIFASNMFDFEFDHALLFDNLGAVRTGGLSDMAFGGAIQINSIENGSIHDNTFRNNGVALVNLEQLKLFGGAIEISNGRNVVLDNNVFTANYGSTTAGGGSTLGGAVDIGNSSFVTVTANAFADNVAELGPSGGLGGALHVMFADDMVVANNRFDRNRAGTGAGIGGALTIEGGAVQLSDFPAPLAAPKLNNRVTVNGNNFQDNRAAIAAASEEVLLGGAIAVNSTNGLRIYNNVVAGNAADAGGAAALIGWDPALADDGVHPALLTNNTIIGNPSASALHLEMWQTPITLTNNIIMSETVGLHLVTGTTGGVKAEAHFTLYNDNGANAVVDQDSSLDESDVITGPVNFVNRWAGDFYLLPTSAARDAGDPAGVPPAPPADLEGVARPFGPAVDIGAYEWHGPVLLIPQVMNNTCAGVNIAGWAVGEKFGGYGAIMHSVDGCTWSRIGDAALIGNNTLTGVSAADANHVWIVGERGTILHTADGGQTWQRQALPSGLPATTQVMKVTAVSSHVVWAIASDSKLSYILRTDDGGATWVKQAEFNLTPGALTSISAASPQDAWAVGARTDSLARGTAGGGAIFHTHDGGAHWVQEADQADPLLAVKAVTSSFAWAVGRGIMVRTTDGGASWVQGSAPTTHDMNRLFSFDGNTVWSGIDDGNVVKTTNGWVSDLKDLQWSSVNVGTMAYLMTVVFIDPNRGWVVSTEDPGYIPPSGAIFGSYDGGLSWARQTVPVNPGFWDMAVVKR